MKRYDDRVIIYAASLGIAESELPIICDGCSGGLSWLYGLMGREISCEQCCHIHDIDYQMGWRLLGPMEGGPAFTQVRGQRRKLSARLEGHCPPCVAELPGLGHVGLAASVRRLVGRLGGRVKI